MEKRLLTNNGDSPTFTQRHLKFDKKNDIIKMNNFIRAVPHMPEFGSVILICLGVVFLLGLIVSMSLRHHIGGFLSNIEREEEEARRERDGEDARTASESQRTKQ